MRYLVCGSREYEDYPMVYSVLKNLRIEEADEDIVIIHGAARGADSLADKAGRELDYAVLPFPADWNKYGKRAGIVRNQQMLDEGYPDIVIAFTRTMAYTPGTADMVARAKKAHILVRHIWGRDYGTVPDRQDS